MMKACDTCATLMAYGTLHLTNNCDQVCTPCWEKALVLEGYKHVGLTSDRSDSSWRWTSRGSKVRCLCGEVHATPPRMRELDRIECWCGRTFQCTGYDGFTGELAKYTWQNIRFAYAVAS